MRFCGSEVVVVLMLFSMFSSLLEPDSYKKGVLRTKRRAPRCLQMKLSSFPAWYWGEQRCVGLHLIKPLFSIYL